jgi:hypothetical protein
MTEDGLIPQTTRQYVYHIYMAGNRPIIGSSKQEHVKLCRIISVYVLMLCMMRSSSIKHYLVINS